MFLDKKKLEIRKTDIRTTEGFTDFYKKYFDYVFSISYRYIGDRDEAYDITSKIFVSIWERRNLIDQKNLQEESSWERYLAKAVKLKIYDHLRSQERVDSYLSTVARELSSLDTTTEKQLSFSELEDQVSLFVSELPPRCKQVYQLSREKGLSNKEIATSLLISESAVKKHIAKALNHLKSQLTDYTLPRQATGA